MDKLIICETDRGRYAARTMSWAGIWNEKGQIQESLNHLALFIEKEDAEKFVEWKTAEEQGKLLKLPCNIGDFVFFINKYELIELHKIVSINVDIDGVYCVSSRRFCRIDDFGKTVFLTREEAEAALKEL